MLVRQMTCHYTKQMTNEYFTKTIFFIHESILELIRGMKISVTEYCRHNDDVIVEY
jgi:hypothetical protein